MVVLPLVGREPEVAVLHELVDRVPDRGGALVVRGQAGIGKTAATGNPGVKALVFVDAARSTN